MSANLLHFVVNYTSAIPWCEISVDQALHGRSSDFNIYKNEWDGKGEDVFSPDDTPLLRTIIKTLMQNNTGVESLKVEKYVIDVFHSDAVSRADVAMQVRNTLLREGYELVEEPRLPCERLGVTVLMSPNTVTENAKLVFMQLIGFRVIRLYK